MASLAIIPGLAHLAKGRLGDALICALLIPALYLVCWPLGLFLHLVSMQHAEEV